MGNRGAPHKRVTNSQKCVRLGGKHNDIDLVGSDGFHHTFFEMLGSWSFGDYFKKEACEMAWELLTKVYKIPPNCLYVTYFRGCPELGIAEDLETKEIWRNLGLSDDRIVSFGPKENFWEMAITGPCGPCTEIHVDHTGGKNRACFINKGLHDLTELWNIVFIQYNRNPDGTIGELPEKHIDTGIGLERLTAFLQGKISNYDTDNFTYLLNAIQKICSNVPQYSGRYGENDWNSLDTAYRIVSDHSRAITVCLADGVIPEQSQKLRRIMRKVFYLSDTVFGKDRGLLKELSNYVIDQLGPIYSELEYNAKNVQQIIDWEEDVYRTLQASANHEWTSIVQTNPHLSALDAVQTPNIVAAYKDVQKAMASPSTTALQCIDGKRAFRLYDAFGLDADAIERLAQALRLTFVRADLEAELEAAKVRSRQLATNDIDRIYNVLHSEDVPSTDDNAKYSYRRIEPPPTMTSVTTRITTKCNYTFDSVNVTVLKIIVERDLVKSVENRQRCGLLLDRTNLFSQDAGGQTNDQGRIQLGGGGDDFFEVDEVYNHNGYVLHYGHFYTSKVGQQLRIGDTGVLSVDGDHRLKVMRNHTASHLLNATIRRLKGATSQKSNKVNAEYVHLDLAIFSSKLTTSEVIAVEEAIRQLIHSRLPVKVRHVSQEQLFNDIKNVILMPGETYDTAVRLHGHEHDVRLVEIVQDAVGKGGGGGGHYFESREPCCGTHVHNTADLHDFCIVRMRSLGRSTTAFYAVTGERARRARHNGDVFLDSVERFQRSIQDNMDTPNILLTAIDSLKRQLYNCHVESDVTIMPQTVRLKAMKILERCSEQVISKRATLNEIVEMEMKNAIETNTATTKAGTKYIVHYLRSSTVLEKIALKNATKLCNDLPVMVIAYTDSNVLARCCVPKQYLTNNFDAEKWLKQTLVPVFQSSAVPGPAGTASITCSLRPKKINMHEWDPLLNDGIEAAKRYIDENI